MSASRARYVTVAFCVVLALITYIDRVAISQAAPFITKDLGLTRIEMGWALAVFGYAYAIFEIPGGWLADRIGPRKVLMRIVMWWSVFTAATGWAMGATSLILVRGLFGAGEAGAFPSMTRTLTTWLPAGERERAQALVWLATRVSAAATPVLVLWLIMTISWRRAFELFGVIGILWAIFFYRWFRDDPGTHRSVNPQELALLPPRAETEVAHSGVPWGRIFSTPAVWLLSVQYMCLAYGWWFYVNWLPTYLREARGTSFQLGALLAGLPLLLGGARLSRVGGRASAARPSIQEREAGAPDSRHCRLRRGLRLDPGLHADPGPGAGDVRPWHGRVLQRPRDAGGLGGHHGRRRALRGHGLRRDEHDGEPRRRVFGDGRRLSADLDRRQLDADVPDLGVNLHGWRRVLAVSGRAHADRGEDSSRTTGATGSTGHTEPADARQLSSFCFSAGISELKKMTPARTYLVPAHVPVAPVVPT